MYSLVNAPTVGFDLARLPTGAAVATVLLEALAVQDETQPAGEPDLTAFDAAQPWVEDPRRAAAWLAVSALTPPANLHDALSGVRRLVDEAARAVHPGPYELEPVLTGLTTAYFGTLDDLVRLLRLDILDDAPAHVVALGSDALAAAYGGRRLADDVRTMLGSPWITAARSLPTIPADLGPYAAESRRVLDRLVLLTPAEANELAVAAGAAEPDWSRRMHAAAWAAYLSGRLRPAAAAQFQAVRAMRASGVDAVTAACGVWNAVSGCLQAVALHDLLDEVTYGVLVAPWETVVGILG
ncbi:MAG: hypothetical protein QOJ62_566 [Actinomycetota bacterium]|nr:hypothetical protein [Actinomycetota bacterium]